MGCTVILARKLKKAFDISYLKNGLFYDGNHLVSEFI